MGFGDVLVYGRLWLNYFALFTENSLELKSVKNHCQVYSGTTSCSLRLMAKAMGRETGKDRMIMTEERITSRGRFSKGSLTMDAAIECTLSADNYSTYKHEKAKSRFKTNGEQ